MDFNFDSIDFSTIIDESVKLKNTTESGRTDRTDKSDKSNKLNKYDITTLETYRTMRILKIDPLSRQEIPEKLRFEFKYKWNPYSGDILEEDPIGPLCFDAIVLYDYFFANRYKGLWNPPSDGFQGFYGDYVGEENKMNLQHINGKPEKYLYRLPIIDCYLNENHNYSHITMGPILSDINIEQIDNIVLKHHKNKNFLTSLKLLKNYYHKAINSNPSDNEFIELKKKYNNLSSIELRDKYNRKYVDILVNLMY